jgi:hypothetical protein
VWYCLVSSMELVVVLDFGSDDRIILRVRMLGIQCLDYCGCLMVNIFQRLRCIECIVSNEIG